MTSRRVVHVSAKAVGSQRDLSPCNDAPLTIRLKEPEGSVMRRDVRLRVDYFSGTVETRAKRVISCLVGTAEGRLLSPADRRALELQLGHWLAQNATALLTGTSVPIDPTEDASELMFVFQTSSASEGTPPRPQPEAESYAPSDPPTHSTHATPPTQPAQPAPPVPGASAVPRTPRRRK